ncbi:hypothetical protein LCGC14_3043420, partial [marine sediment metagenome]
VNVDITDLKIGRDATFIPPFKSNLNWKTDSSGLI